MNHPHSNPISRKQMLSCKYRRQLANKYIRNKQRTTNIWSAMKHQLWAQKPQIPKLRYENTQTYLCCQINCSFEFECVAPKPNTIASQLNQQPWVGGLMLKLTIASHEMLCWLRSPSSNLCPVRLGACMKLYFGLYLTASFHLAKWFSLHFLYLRLHTKNSSSFISWAF